jgi:hypothetical protein
MLSRFGTAVFGLFAVTLSACSSSDKSDNEGTPADSAGGSGSTGACDINDVASAKDLCPNFDPDPCKLNSGYKGDEYCIAPPPEGKGIQIHFGPKDYKDPEEVAKYVLKPGQEVNGYGIADIPVEGDKYYNYTQIRMRPGSHHLINTMVQGADLKEGFLDAKGGCPGTQLGSFPGSQNLVRNMPPGGVQAPENVGIGAKLVGGDTKLCINHHGYNFTDDEEVLREVWINVWFVDEADVTQKANSIFVIAGPWQGIAPHTQTVLTADATVPNDGRIVNMFGHRHAATDRFTVKKNDDLVYDSWHWDESVAFDYDSITNNPPLAPDAKKDGAPSGILDVKTGDKISIECDVNNTTDNTLTFKNELYTGEMCILFGASVDTSIRGGLMIPGTGGPTE